MEKQAKAFLPAFALLALTACNQPDAPGPAAVDQDSPGKLDSKNRPFITNEQIRAMGGNPDLPESPETGEAEIVMPDGKKETVTYTVVDGYRVYNGDIIIGREGGPAAKTSANVWTGQKWPGGIVPYEFGTNNQAKITASKAAMNYWMANTPIRFVAKTSKHENYIRIVDGSANLSTVGMQGGPQNLTLKDGAGESTVSHEIGHAIGLFHEHNRTDRGGFVSILNEIDACDPDLEGAIQYNGYGSNEEALLYNRDICPKVGTVNGAYDKTSLMHYQALSRKVFCLVYKDNPNGCYVVDLEFKAKTGSLSGAGLTLSAGDKAAINEMYLRGSAEGDIYTDLNFFEPGNGNVYEAKSNGASGFVPAGAVWATGIEGSRKDRIVTGDFDGNGMIDLGFLRSDGTFSVYRSTGSAYLPRQDWILPGEFGHDNGRHYAGDFNGDGYCDIIFYEHGNKNVYFAKSTGSDFVPDGVPWITSGFGDLPNNFHPGDYNGDGMTDIGFWTSGQMFRVKMSLGYGFGPTQTWIPSGHFGNQSVTPFIGDLTGDGRDDMIHFIAGVNELWVKASTGTGFSASVKWVTSNSFGSVPAYYQVGDFNGDYKSDLAYFEPAGTGTFYVRLSTGSGLGGGTAWLSNWGNYGGRFILSHRKQKRVNVL